MPSLYQRASVSRVRGGLSSNFRTSRRMAATYVIRAQVVKGRMRAALGACASLVYAKRKEILRETIYERPPTTRPLTRRLWNSEKMLFSGNAAIMDNTAPYSHLRHAMSGTSKTYGHELDSFWASRAIQETSAQRAKIYRDAIKGVWQQRA